MAKQFKMTKGGETVYPQSITDAIADTKRKKVLTVVIDDVVSSTATAQSTANTAKSTAETAKANAATAQSTADTAKTNAAIAQTTATEAKTSAATANTEIAKTNQKVADIEDDAQLQNKTTVAAAVGKVPAGAQYDANTPVSSIIADILAFASPTFSILRMYDGSKDYGSNNTVFCSSDEIRFQTIKHAETNVGSIKGKVSLDINGTKSEQTPSATVANVTINEVFTRTSNKASFYVELTGTNTLSAAIPSKRVTWTAYMPVYCFITNAQDEATVKAGLANATAETTVYTGSHTIDKTGTFVAGGAWCVALPSHMAMAGIGTVADFGFGTQKTSTTTVSATRTVNGIASVPYTVYLLPMGTAQTSLPVRITTKAK